MKVKDLITLLQEANPNLEVLGQYEDKGLMSVHAHHIQEECVDREEWEVLEEGKPNSLVIYLY